MDLATRLRAIADLLDLLKTAGLAEQACPIDDNSTLEFTEAAHNFCLESAEGWQLLQLLQSGGMSFFVHEDISYRDSYRDELDILFEV